MCVRTALEHQLENNVCNAQRSNCSLAPTFLNPRALDGWLGGSE